MSRSIAPLRSNRGHLNRYYSVAPKKSRSSTRCAPESSRHRARDSARVTWLFPTAIIATLRMTRVHVLRGREETRRRDPSRTFARINDTDLTERGTQTDVARRQCVWHTGWLMSTDFVPFVLPCFSFLLYCIRNRNCDYDFRAKKQFRCTPSSH